MVRSAAGDFTFAGLFKIYQASAKEPKTGGWQAEEPRGDLGKGPDGSSPTGRCLEEHAARGSRTQAGSGPETFAAGSGIV
jgi:hypothetical protein